MAFPIIWADYGFQSADGQGYFLSGDGFCGGIVRRFLCYEPHDLFIGHFESRFLVRSLFYDPIHVAVGYSGIVWLFVDPIEVVAIILFVLL